MSTPGVQPQVAQATRITPVPLLKYASSAKINGIIYGNSGVGKTILATSSKTLKTLVFDVDRGMTSARRMHGLDHGQLIDVCPVSKWPEFLESIIWLLSNKHPYELVVIDTATELAKLVLAEVTKVGANIITPEVQHWGKLLTAMETLARHLRTAPFHTLMLAHEDVDVINGKWHYKPNFQGAFRLEFAKHFDIILRQFVVDVPVQNTEGIITTQTQRWLNCQRDEYVHAKDRFMILDKFEYPDYGLDYLFGKLLSALTTVGDNQ